MQATEIQTHETESAPKTVLLGVTGCIAAYKACEIVRGLQKAGVRVKVVMTQHATEFVGPLTFRSLTHEPVAVGLFDNPSDPIHHISLAEEADLFLLAPCTANVLAKMAHGIADDLLTTTALATTAPVLVAPAMNVHMYEAAATQENMRTLAQRGVRFVEAEEGYLACGDVGKGRLAAVDAIVEQALTLLEAPRDLAGVKVMITAGPTREPIDPVRYISNYSSGKMGYALAQAAVERGADVTLISGPVALPDVPGAHMVRVEQACEMLEAAEEAYAQAQLALFSAAVADVRPEQRAHQKLKKAQDSQSLSRIDLVENPDILATLGAKKDQRVVIGFAAETTNVVPYAQQKLTTKNANLIVANEVGKGKGFGVNTNKAWLVEPQQVTELPEMSKRALAEAILDRAVELLKH